MKASYNGFTPQERMRGLRVVKKAIKDGVIPPAEKCTCCLCGQNEGIIQYHSEDYTLENIVNQVKPLCWTCHMMLHNRFRHPKSWANYILKISNGWKAPAQYSNNFGVLWNYYID